MIINIFAKQLKDIVGERLHLHFFPQNSFSTLHSQNHIITVIVCIPTQNQAHPWETQQNYLLGDHKYSFKNFSNIPDGK